MVRIWSEGEGVEGSVCGGGVVSVVIALVMLFCMVVCVFVCADGVKKEKGREDSNPNMYYGGAGCAAECGGACGG